MDINERNGKKVFGLVGRKLGHSFSSGFFTEKFSKEGIDAVYLNFEIADIEHLTKLLRDYPRLKGFNVTIPYKTEILPFLNHISEEAQEIGAVNVVRINDNKELIGYNSDVYGFVKSLSPLLPGHGGIKALVLGTGGASKAVCYGLRRLGIEFTKVSRSSDNGDITYSELTPEIVNTHRVIVNTTPLGMYPDISTAPDIPYAGIGHEHICYDLVYNPADTLFMKKCREKGAKVKNGLEMLCLQAERSWEIWNEQERNEK